MEVESPEPGERPGRWLRVVRRAHFARLMGAAIEATLVRRAGLTPERARSLRAAAMQRFGALFAARTRRVRALTKSECRRELEREHGALLRRRLHWNTELASLAGELARARTSSVESGLSAAEEASLARALEGDLRTLLGAREQGVLSEVLAREAERRAHALAGVLERERRHADVQERRLAKVREELAHMEARIADLARRAELDPGLPSIYSSVQGLAAGAQDREAKLEMLASIFEQNLVLQRRGA